MQAYTVPDHFLIRYKKVLRIGPAFTLDKVIRYYFVLGIRYGFVHARKEEQFCTCTAPKLYRYSVNAREKEHFCIGSKVIRCSVNAAKDASFAKSPLSCQRKLLKSIPSGHVKQSLSPHEIASISMASSACE